MECKDGFKYLESDSDGEVLLMLHGLLGGLSNFDAIYNKFSKDYKVVMPELPILELPVKDVGLASILKFIEEFVEYKGYKNVHVLGNSLGGHLAQLYALQNPDNVKSVILTGSSGLFENAMGNTFPKRGNYEYIKKKAEDVFYDPAIATKELVDSIFETINDRMKAIRVIVTAKSAIRHNLGDRLHSLKKPVLLIWGANDSVTPPFVAEKFHDLLPNSTLHFIEKCGHAPMMERPAQFNELLEQFLNNLK